MRKLRILARYIEPDARFRDFNACYTIVFFDLAPPLFEGDGHLADYAMSKVDDILKISQSRNDSGSPFSGLRYLENIVNLRHCIVS